MSIKQKLYLFLTSLTFKLHSFITSEQPIFFYKPNSCFKRLTWLNSFTSLIFIIDFCFVLKKLRLLRMKSSSVGPKNWWYYIKLNHFIQQLTIWFTTCLSYDRVFCMTLLKLLLNDDSYKFYAQLFDSLAACLGLSWSMDGSFGLPRQCWSLESKNRKPWFMVSWSRNIHQGCQPGAY